MTSQETKNPLPPTSTVMYYAWTGTGTNVPSDNTVAIGSNNTVFYSTSAAPVAWLPDSKSHAIISFGGKTAGTSLSATTAMSGVGIVGSSTNVATIGTLAPASESQVTSYAELNDALVDMHNLDDDGDWKIQTPVYSASVQVAAALMQYGIPRPGVFTHGPKSVVFNWSQDDINLYLTVSQRKLSILVSSAAC